jgi:hypothetical protein
MLRQQRMEQRTLVIAGGCASCPKYPLMNACGSAGCAWHSSFTIRSRVATMPCFAKSCCASSFAERSERAAIA